MRIITLQGRADTGKSTTLRHLIKKINSIPTEPVLHSLRYKYGLASEALDVWAVYSNVKNKVVAVITAGDQKSYVEAIYNSILAKYKEKFNKDLAIDVLVVASHNNKSMNAWLNTLSAGNLEIIAKEGRAEGIGCEQADIDLAEKIFNFI